MPDPQIDQTGPKTPSWKRGRRRKVLAAIAGMVFVFLLWLQFRGGQTVERPLVALLPADTPMAVQVHRLADLLAAYDTSPLAPLLETDVEVGALLLSQDDFRDWREAHREAELQTHLDLGRSFLLAWAGRELTLAFIHAQGEPRPGLVAISQADLGFRERLAELVAQLYPGAQLQTVTHRGTSITTHVGDAPRDSLSFCRFGETVALSLRTDSTAYLRAIIDAVHAEEPPEQPVFPPPTVPGVHAWVDAARLPRFLEALDSETLTSWLGSPEGRETMGMVDRFADARLSYTLESPRTLRVDLNARPEAVPAVTVDPSWTTLVRRDALVVAHFEKPARWWGMFGHFLVDHEIALDPDWSPERRRRHAAKREWRVRLGLWLEEDLLPLLDGPATLVLDGAVPRLGLPGVRAALVWETSQPEHVEVALRATVSDFAGTIGTGIAPDHMPTWMGQPWFDREVGGQVFQSWHTPIGILGWTTWEDRLLVTLDDLTQPLTPSLLAGWSDTVADQPARRAVVRLWGDAVRPAEICLHARALSEISSALVAGASLWSESARRNLHRLRLASSLFAQYPSLGLAVRQSDDTVSLVLAVAASDEVASE